MFGTCVNVKYWYQSNLIKTYHIPIKEIMTKLYSNWNHVNKKTTCYLMEKTVMPWAKDNF